jgi:hypothetical protein
VPGDLPAKDMQGHFCSSRRKAQEHAVFIAQQIGAERPEFVKPGNRIEVREEQGEVFFRAHKGYPARLADAEKFPSGERRARQGIVAAYHTGDPRCFVRCL